MAQIKSALEIAMEKSKNIDKLSPGQMLDIKQQKKIENVLARYYKNEIQADLLWHHLKGISNKYLVKAQNNLIQSFSFQSNAYEMGKRKDGILAIEDLKDSSQSSAIEQYFETFKKIQHDLQKDKERLIQNFQKELENDPQKRLQTFRNGNQIMVKQISIEEALEQDQQFKEHLHQTETEFKKRFNENKEKLSDTIQE